MKNFDNFGIMLDCSRNAVSSVETVKKFIDLISKMGYTFLELYTEDTFEVEGHPYIGHQRGRYSKQELIDLDNYAYSKGIELIPCIQTLAHVNGVLRWPEYSDIIDCDDIMMADNEKTYALIESFISSCANCFRSRKINIGMDEAHKVGVGRYLDKNGYHDRTGILLRHLSKVCEICDKYGFKPMMWSDMFFRLANEGEYVWNGKPIDEETKNLVPKNVELIYWNYCQVKKSEYVHMIKGHKQFNNNIWFAGGTNCWYGFNPHNRFAFKTIKPSVTACLEQGIRNYTLCLWGDDGNECSIFSNLPSLFYASELAKGITDMATIKLNFEKLFGIPFDKFMLLDLKEPDVTTNCEFPYPTNMGKVWLYNDVFSGLFDTTVDKDLLPNYRKVARSLKKYVDNPDYGYIFDYLSSYADAVYRKAELGIRTRELYTKKDIEGLKHILKDYDIASKKIKTFLKKFRTMWYTERKPHGFDIQDIRIGGLLTRIDGCKQRIIDYIEGKADSIPELDEPTLDFFSRKGEDIKQPINFNRWQYNASPNIVSHLVFF